MTAKPMFDLGPILRLQPGILRILAAHSCSPEWTDFHLFRQRPLLTRNKGALELKQTILTLLEKSYRNSGYPPASDSPTRKAKVDLIIYEIEQAIAQAKRAQIRRNTIKDIENILRNKQAKAKKAKRLAAKKEPAPKEPPAKVKVIMNPPTELGFYY